MEPEYDANERDAWYALDELGRAICPDCGNLAAICSTPDGLTGEGYYPQRRVCYATAAREAAWRQYTRPYKKTEPDAAGFHPLDGVAVYVALTDENPEDDFLSPPSDLTPSD